MPKAKRLGILFSPGEPLSVSLKDKMTAAAEKAGLMVVAMPINSVSEGTEATTALLGKKVDAIEIYGNAAHAAFESIIAVAKAAKVPVFSPSPFEVQKGATAAFYPDFQEGGVVAGHMIGQILKGESPATIPFYQVADDPDPDGRRLRRRPGHARQAVAPCRWSSRATVPGPSCASPVGWTASGPSTCPPRWTTSCARGSGRSSSTCRR